MRAADLFCQPNDGPEPFGVVFAEALLCGVPVVTADTGGAPEIVSGECGRLVPAGDLDALARVLGELIADAGLRRRLGACGPAHAAARTAPEVILPRIASAIASLGQGRTG
jgi:glycosyltransferase involved in cell wall biosynthesis